MLKKTRILQIQTTSEKIELISTKRDKMSQPKNVHFEKKDPKIKSMTISLFMTTFHDVILKVETG